MRKKNALLPVNKSVQLHADGKALRRGGIAANAA